MIRGYTTGRTFNQNTLPVRAYQTSTILLPELESAECKFIQQKKDELLVSLTKYFGKEIEKNDLVLSLNTIKTDLANKCPAYVPRVGCC